MDVQGYRGDLEGCVLRFVGPLQLRVEVRVVGVGLPACVAIGIRRDEADGRVVEPLFAPVIVRDDGPLGPAPPSCSHGVLRE